MSDSVDDLGELGRHVLEGPQPTALRDRMRRYLDEHAPPDDWKSLRSEVGGGRDLSDIVAADREERL